MNTLPKLVYYYVNPDEEPWFILDVRFGDYNARTNKMTIYYSTNPLLHPRHPIRNFITIFHEFIHWLIPSYMSKSPFRDLGVYLHSFHDVLWMITRALINRDKNWIYPYGNGEAKISKHTIERGNAKGFRALIRTIMWNRLIDLQHEGFREFKNCRILDYFIFPMR